MSKHTKCEQKWNNTSLWWYWLWFFCAIMVKHLANLPTFSLLYHLPFFSSENPVSLPLHSVKNTAWPLQCYRKFQSEYWHVAPLIVAHWTKPPNAGGTEDWWDLRRPPCLLWQLDEQRPSKGQHCSILYRLEWWSILYGNGKTMVVFLQRWNGDLK